ncbi:MAG: hypothetical protein HC942_27245 [Microcoleus sp. SU_5_6]|nr:hypothetical protein [Microcoleus sp. SU_5_6]
MKAISTQNPNQPTFSTKIKALGRIGEPETRFLNGGVQFDTCPDTYI